MSWYLRYSGAAYIGAYSDDDGNLFRLERQWNVIFTDEISGHGAMFFWIYNEKSKKKWKKQWLNDADVTNLMFNMRVQI